MKYKEATVASETGQISPHEEILTYSLVQKAVIVHHNF